MPSLNNEQRDAAIEDLRKRVEALETPKPAEAADVRHEDDQPGQ